MGYQRLTVDLFDIQGNYGQGYETVTCEESFLAAREQVKCYRENEPGTPFRIHFYREKISHD